MKFCDKLIILRREKGYSQEQLASVLGVSRQSVSKWEAGASMPEISKILQLSGLFKVTTDYLLKEEEERRNPDSRQVENFDRTAQNDILERLERMEQREKENNGEYEYVSKRKLWGLPLIHIHFKWTKGCRPNMGGFRMPGLYMDFSAKAKGIIAIGNHAKGILSIGFLATGLFSIGMFSIGGISIGIICLGLLAMGVLSLGGVAAGVVGIGYMAMGISVIGLYGTGIAALAGKAATGVCAVAHTAIGSEDVDGTYTALVSDFSSKKEMLAFLMEHQPDIPKWIAFLLTWVFKI